MSSIYKKRLGLLPMLLLAGTVDLSAGGHYNYNNVKGALSIQKSTNGIDADLAPGPKVQVGSTVKWTYLVKNTGNTTVYDGYIQDNKVGRICHIGTLTPGATKTCTKTGIAIAGQYENIASVTGYYKVGYYKKWTPKVTDKSHYFGIIAKPAINIEKATNGVDADTGTGPNIPFGGAVTWSYVVKNTGNVALTNVAVNDNKAGAICTIGALAAGASKTCTKTGVAISGQYANIGTATGKYGATTLTDTDASHYFGGNKPVAAINIEKATNGIDADTGTGPIIPFGGAVTWTYMVQNTGNVALTNVAVTDNKLGAICTIGALAAGTSKTCTKTGTATAGQYANIGTATGKYGTQTVTDTDASHYLGGSATKVSIGDYVWWDQNKNGIQDAGEPGIANAIVKLRDATTRKMIQSVRTDANGKYSFTNLPAGSKYYVQFYKPTGYVSATGKKRGTNIALDSDGGSTGKTTKFTVGTTNNLTLDMGWVKPYTAKVNVGDYVWNDKNKNGIQDAGEPGIPNVRVKLRNGLTGKKVQSTVTDANGKYLFTNVPAANYYIQFYKPNGYKATSRKQGNNNAKDSDGGSTGKTARFNLTATNLNLDMGYYQNAPANSYAVGDLVWYDKNGNGKQDNGETGAKNVTLKLYKGNKVIKTTKSSLVGQYLFSKLPAGNYCVEVIAPKTYNLTTGAAKNCFTLNANKTNVDFGINKGTTPHGKINVGDYVWYDQNKDGIQNAGEPGIANVRVKLRKAATGAKVQTVKTDANGKYLFTNVAPGKYYIQFYKPAGYKPTSKKQGNNNAKDSDGGATGKTAKFNLTATNLNLDMGYTKKGGVTPPPGLGNVGDFVWYDKNKNGIQDAGEKGAKNKVVRLYKANGKRVGTTRTDANGKYLFKNVPGGQYYMRFVIPKKYTTSPQNQGTNIAKDSDGNANGKTALFTVTAGNNLSIDMGLTKGGTPPPPAGKVNVGDFVWFDKNKNGIQDAGEKGIKNKVVKLYKANGKRVATTRTDVNGKYLFKNVPNGQYYIRFTIPKKYTASPKNQGTNTAKDSDGAANGKTALFTVANKSNLSIDMGLTKGGVTPPNGGAIGDLVWYDKNHDGIQDAGETGVKNIKVTIYDLNDKSLQTTKTDANGNYKFTNVPAGKYIVKFDLPSCTQASPMDEGTNDAKDSDGDYAGVTDYFNYNGKSTKMNIDMGLSFMGCSTAQKKKLNVNK